MKSLVSRRRRGDEEGEDDEGPVMVEDSQSEGSVLSDLEDDDEADTSSMAQSSAVGGGADSTHGEVIKAAAKKQTRNRNGKKQTKECEPTPVESSQLQPQPAFKPAPDTEAMLNGLPIGHQSVQAVVDFEGTARNANVDSAASASAPVIVSTDRSTTSPAIRQRKEHEEYRRKREADPSFVSNRGNFFMHDTRANQGQGTLPFRGAWAGRGRGRGGGGNAGGHFAPVNQVVQQEKVAEEPWKHDLHDTINEEPAPAKPADLPQHQIESPRLFSKTGGQNNNNGPHAKLSFSSTTLVGKVQIRVLLPGMKAPITFSEVPWKQYTRLPDHRPPLRRDKPVRISIPEHVQRYIFPSSQRSFIFIPRQMRPNQRGYGNDRYQRSIGGIGYSSRRTSMYGGSVYAGSIAASRRSSFASIARENAFSPVGSYVGMPPNRPVVRLPHGAHGSQMGPLSGHQTPTGMHMHTFPPPAQPYHQGTPTTTVHQPRPQKVISVTGIESPAMLSQAHGPAEQQPFANQLPAHMHDHQTLPPPYFSPRQQFSFPQRQSGTPLSGIPEQAMHAPAFQPMIPYTQGPYYAPYPSQQQGYYYPSGHNGFNPMPMYIPPQQNYMMAPPSAPAVPPPRSPVQQRPSQTVEGEESSAPSGMVAHESNGMVFYLPAADASTQAQGENYQPAESFVPAYAMPGLPPPTPAPESAYFYPPPQMPMASFYPGPGQQQ